MQIEIATPLPDQDENLRVHIERRLRFALSRVSQRISRVVVRLSDMNGPRGGTDKHCSIQVHLFNLPPVVVEGLHHDWISLVDASAHRCGVTTVKRIERANNRRRLIQTLNKTGWPGAQPAAE